MPKRSLRMHAKIRLGFSRLPGGLTFTYDQTKLQGGHLRRRATKKHARLQKYETFKKKLNSFQSLEATMFLGGGEGKPRDKV